VDDALLAEVGVPQVLNSLRSYFAALAMRRFATVAVDAQVAARCAYLM
jgi:hypothetical protein